MKFKNMLFPKMVCPAWIPELNSVEHGPEGKEGFALSPRKAGKLGMGPLGGVASQESLSFGCAATCFSWSWLAWGAGTPFIAFLH